MNKDRETYFYNPYLPEQREDKGERMNIIKSTLIICATILLSVVAIIFFTTQHERFVIIGDKTGIFIFDHKTSATNYCTTTGCKMISSEFVLPKFTTIVETVPTNQQQMSPQAVQSQLVSPNFSKMPTSQQQPQPGAPPVAQPGIPPVQPGMAPQPAAPTQPGVPAQFAGVAGGAKKPAAPAAEEEGGEEEE
jgi:hypothetical protein